MGKLTLALLLFGLFAAGAAISSERVSRLRSEASWLLTKPDPRTVDDAASPGGSLVDPEPATFERGRAFLERAHRWQQLEIACVLAAAAAATVAYAIYLVRRARHYPLQDGMLGR